MNVIKTNDKFPESLRVLAQELIGRYIAATTYADTEAGPRYDGTHADGRRMHAHVSRGARFAQFEDSTGGNVWVAYSMHVDSVSGESVIFQGGCDGCNVYRVPEADRDTCELYGLVWDMECERAEDADNAAPANLIGEDSGESDILAAAFKLFHAAELLELECVRIFDEVLEEGQRDALRDGSQCFAMLDDMEARMGFGNIIEARSWCEDAHAILELAGERAKQIHETFLCIEFAHKINGPRERGGFALNDGGDAYELHMEHAADSIGDWCEAFIARWDSKHGGIDARYIPRSEEEDSEPEDESAADVIASIADENEADDSAYARVVRDCDLLRRERDTLRTQQQQCKDCETLRATVAMLRATLSEIRTANAQAVETLRLSTSAATDAMNVAAYNVGGRR
jgi:hypothetical protein